MENIQALINRPEFWNIIYILLGFSLGQFATGLRDWLKSRKLKAALRSELEGNLYQVKEKQNIIEQMIQSLENGGVLPGGSVPCGSTAYTHHFPVIIDRLTSIECDNIRQIYGTLGYLDSYLNEFETTFLHDIKNELFENTVIAHISKLNDIHLTYQNLITLIQSYLDGNPVDIFKRKKVKKNKIST